MSGAGGSDPRRVAGVILAAGLSSRWGEGCKLLEPYDGDPIVRAVARTAVGADLDPVVVVAGRRADAIRAALRDLPIRVVVNDAPERGQAVSLVRGIEALREERVVAAAVLLGDEPGLSGEAILDVVEAWRSADLPIARALYRDRPGHPVVFGAGRFPALTRPTGGRGGGALLAERADEVLRVALDREAPRDIDTPEDYAALVADGSSG